MLTWEKSVAWKNTEFPFFVFQRVNPESKLFQTSQTSRTFKAELTFTAPTQQQAQGQAIVHQTVGARGLNVANIKKRIGVTRGRGAVLDVLNLESEHVFACAESGSEKIKGE